MFQLFLPIQYLSRGKPIFFSRYVLCYVWNNITLEYTVSVIKGEFYLYIFVYFTILFRERHFHMLSSVEEETRTSEVFHWLY